MNGLLIFGVLVFIIFYFIYVLAHKKFDYWKKKNVPYVKPLPFLGNYAKYILLQEYPGHVVQKLCQKFSDAPYVGAYYGTEPVLIVKSPELLKHILTKDFYYFHGREITKYQSKEIITQNLFLAGGNRWKIVRQNLTPLFSSGKMKNMFYLVEKCCYSLEDSMDRETGISEVVEVKELCARFTMDSISSSGFGVEANTQIVPENNPFDLIGKEIFSSTNYRGFKIVFRAIWPYIFYGLGFHCFPSTIDKFFEQLLKNVFKARNYKPTNRNDFVDLVLSLKSSDTIISDDIANVKTGLNEKVHLKVDDDLLLSQCVVFFAAGFETSSSVLSFTLFELAKNQQAQKVAAEEVIEYLRRNGNKLHYECIKELPYLEACVNETMRIYPVIGNITREVMDDCILPDGLRLNKGVRIHVPVYHLHHNPDYFPDPDTYNPERFLPDNKENIKPYTYLPFGEGPRICIGKRYALMQVFAGLITILKKYRVELAENMTETVELECRSFLIQPRDQGLLLKLIKREGWEHRKLARS